MARSGHGRGSISGWGRVRVLAVFGFVVAVAGCSSGDDGGGANREAAQAARDDDEAAPEDGEANDAASGSSGVAATYELTIYESSTSLECTDTECVLGAYEGTLPVSLRWEDGTLAVDGSQISGEVPAVKVPDAPDCAEAPVTVTFALDVDPDGRITGEISHGELEFECSRAGHGQFSTEFHVPVTGQPAA